MKYWVFLPNNNEILFFKYCGIDVSGDKNVIIGNLVSNNTVHSDPIDSAGIWIEGGGDFNVIDANACYNCTLLSGFDGIGILISNGCNNDHNRSHLLRWSTYI